MNLSQLTDALLDVSNRVATLTLNRHDVRNALTGTGLIEDIITVAEWINRCDEVSVLVMTGAGSAFSSGGNVKDMGERGGDFPGDVAEVATWLATRGVAFEEDPDASVTCAGPVVGVLRFATDIDRAAVDLLLRSYPD